MSDWNAMLTVLRNDLEKELKERERINRQIADHEAAIRVVEKHIKDMEGAPHKINLEPGNFKVSGSSVHLQKGDSLASSVRKIIKSFGSRPFTRPEIDDVLKREGKMPGGKNPTATIAQILNDLRSRDFILIVETGGGSTPNKYAYNQRQIGGDQRDNL